MKLRNNSQSSVSQPVGEILSSLFSHYKLRSAQKALSSASLIWTELQSEKKSSPLILQLFHWASCQKINRNILQWNSNRSISLFTTDLLFLHLFDVKPSLILLSSHLENNIKEADGGKPNENFLIPTQCIIINRVF